MLELLDPSLLRAEIKQLTKKEGEIEAFSLGGRKLKTMCPKCNAAPKAITGKGTMRPYCEACTKAYDIAYRNTKRPRTRALTDMTVCFRCQKEPRAVSKSGRVRPYCRECFNWFNRQYKSAKTNGQPT